MTLPFISCICCTYARPEHLVESLAGFLEQKYDGQRELVILNSFSQQRLLGDFPNVRIINLPERPPSLGAARNLAIEAARGDVLLTWDDDDRYLPNHLSNFGKHFTDGTDWVWHDRQFYMEGWKIKSITQGTFNVFAYRKSAWLSVGKFPEMNSGEDRWLVCKITEKHRGVKAPLADNELSFLYHWGNGLYHISGLGVDKPGVESGHTRVGNWIAERVRLGHVPTGDIVLKPKLAQDYVQMAAEFIGAKAPANPKMDATCILLLGRLGDILNALPIARNIFLTTGVRPHWMISHEFANILDGVSYVVPFPVNLTYHQINEAKKLAGETFGKVIVCQIYGHNHKQETLTPSWPQESWRQAGCLDHFHDPAWPLIFDRRDLQREQALVQKLFKTNKPKIITNLTSAHSVPFASGQNVLSLLRSSLPDYEIVDIGPLRVERFYDFLAVYERASLIVSIDTATAHLAAAVQVPLVALVNPSHWLGPVQRLNCAARIPYNVASPQAVLEAVRKALQPAQASKLDLSKVTLWACCWSDDKQMLSRTLRVLRYCYNLADWSEVLLFSYLPLTEKPGFPLRLIQITPLTPETWNIFHVHQMPAFISSDWALGVHEDGFPLDATKWSADFFNYDYIGAPWTDGLVGNGGFCLESRRFLKAKSVLPHQVRLAKPVPSLFGPLHFHPSDDYVCRQHRRTLEAQGLKFAPVNIARQFSTECTDQNFPSFGFHGRVAARAKYEQGWKLIG